MQLPQFQSSLREFQMMQSQWGSILNPVLKNPTTNMSILKDVQLSAGTNTINHLLGQMQQGWIILDINAAATVYRSQPFNDKTLTLVASAPVTVTLGVF